jgi:undecaprenyl phosphate-alpha-L-ara4FN deformylase
MENDHPITVGLRIDVDTYRGTRDGVPKLLELLARYDIKASFFFSLGPDNMGRHLWRLLKPRFLIKMLRSRATSLYGWDILLRGTLWPGPEIGNTLAPVIRQTDQAGHEIGLHAWDHHHWQTQMQRMDRIELREDMQRGIDKLTEILGRPPSCSAVAGWKCSDTVLQEKNTLGFKYNSDCRGQHIFYPIIEGIRCSPQIPVTLPTYDEIIGRQGIANDNYNAHLLSLLRIKQLNVLTIHAEVEGGICATLFASFLQTAHARQISFTSLGDILSTHAEIPEGQIENRPITGREGEVCWQADLSMRHT